MLYIMKRKLFGFGDDFTIEDESGEDVFFVDGKVFSVGPAIVFKDMEGNILASVRQKEVALRPAYNVYRAGNLYAEVTKKEITLTGARFFVDIPGPDDLDATGDFKNHEYRFVRHGETVATVSKKWVRREQSYGIKIEEGEDDALVLACAAVIDVATSEKSREGESRLGGY